MELNLSLRSARVAVSFLAVFLLICVLVAPATAIWLTLPSSGTKCVSEEIQSNVVVLADYVVIDDSIDIQHHYPTISASVFWLASTFHFIFSSLFCFTDAWLLYSFLKFILIYFISLLKIQLIIKFSKGRKRWDEFYFRKL